MGKIKRKYKKKRKSKKLKVYKKKRGKLWILRLPMILPDSAMIPFKYVQTATLVNVAGAGTIVMRMNSIFDPNQTGGGHQPAGHDQWANFYSHYEVLSSSIKAVAFPPDVNPCRLIIGPTQSLTPILGSILAENAYGKSTYVNNATLGVTNILKNYISVRKFEGRNTASVNFTAAFGTNPTNSRFWQVSLESLTATSIADIPLDIEVIYYTKMFGRISLSQS